MSWVKQPIVAHYDRHHSVSYRFQYAWAAQFRVVWLLLTALELIPKSEAKRVDVIICIGLASG
jgi:hypothetical protein